MKDSIIYYMEEYLAFCKSNKSRSDRTLKVYRMSISQYIELLHFGENSSLENIFKDSVKVYYDYLLDEGYELSTITVRMRSIRLFLMYLEGKKIISNVSDLFAVDNIKHLYNLEKVELLEEKASADKIEYTDLLNSVSESDITTLITDVIHYSSKFEYGSKKYQRFSRDAVILIFSYYLCLGTDKLCGLKSEDVVILDDKVTVSILSSRGVIHKLYLHDAFFVSIIKQYFQVTKELITQTGYFLVNIQFKNKLTETCLLRTLKSYKFHENIALKLTTKFLKDVRLLHLLKRNQDIYYIQQLFDYDIDVLLQKIKYFKEHCQLSYDLNTQTNVII